MTIKLKQIFIPIGLALIIGVFAGNYFSVTKYYLMNPNDPKREITEAFYKEDQRERHYDNDYKSKEETFNLESALIYGAATLGIMLIITGIRNKD